MRNLYKMVGIGLFLFACYQFDTSYKEGIKMRMTTTTTTIKNPSEETMKKINSLEFQKGVVKDGKYTEFYEDGNTKIEANYDNGRLTGKYTEFYENGMTKIEAFYKDGKGIHSQYFDSDGDLRKDCSC